MIAAMELFDDVAADRPYPSSERRALRACEHARRHGVWLRPLGDEIVLMPPLAIRLEQIDRIAAAAEQGIRAATET